MKRTNPESNPQSRGTGANPRRPLAVAAWALGLVATQATAAPGDLDPSFGDHGRVWVDSVASGLAYPYYKVPIARQGDGKIVVATSTGASSVSVTRLEQDGSIDPTFGNGGTVSLDFGGVGPKASMSALAVGADGKIVLAGQVVRGLQPATDVAVVRLNANGSLDATFGSGGRVMLDFRQGFDNSASAVTVLPDGRIVVAAGSQQVNSGTPEVAGLFRLKPDGTPDTGFGAAGRVVVGDEALHSRFNSLQVLADGRLLACGEARPDKSTLYFAARLMPDGSFDPKFGSKGKSFANDSVGLAHACVARPDGRVLLVGADGYSSARVVQLDAAGDLDRAFGDNGAATIRFPCNAWCSENLGLAGIPGGYFTDVLVMPDGGLVAAGESPGGDLGVARLDVHGHPDSKFGSDGKRIFDLGHNAFSSGCSGAAILLQPDGRLIAAGLGRKTTAILRLNLDDSPGASVVGFLPSWKFVAANEGDSIRATLRRSGSSNGAVSVDFAAIDGTATATTDYVASRSTVTWADGDTADKVVVVAIVRDDIAENSEAFRLVLSNPSGAGLTMSEATVDIGDAPPPSPPSSIGNSNGTPTVSGGGTGNGGGGGSIGPALLSLLALLMIRASRRKTQLGRVVHH